MQASEFTKAVTLKGLPILALKGSLSEKSAPDHVMFTDVQEIPEVLNTPIGDLMALKQWRPLIDNEWDLPNEPDTGDIVPTKQGKLFLFCKESWVMLNNV